MAMIADLGLYKTVIMAEKEHLTISLDFHGVQVLVMVDDEVCGSLVAADFSYFRKDLVRNPSLSIAVSLTEPPYDRIPTTARLRRVTKDAKVYEADGIRYLDSFGKALVIWAFTSESIEIYSADRELLREKAYLMIMSRVGYFLDRRGLHRIHAMGVVFKGRAVVCAMAMGGGKTTLTLGLMEHHGFSLLSDEVPLVSRNGQLSGMPIRLGVREDAELAIPAEFVSRFVRTRYPPKLLIDAGYFGERVETSAEPGIFFVGRREGLSRPGVRPVGSLAAFRVLFEMCVLARGVPELLEYVLRTQPRALARQALIFLSRLRACYALLRGSRCYLLDLSGDPEANARFVAAFVARELEDEHEGRVNAA